MKREEHVSPNRWHVSKALRRSELCFIGFKNRKQASLDRMLVGRSQDEVEEDTEARL